jgi:L-rhamnose-H+ transport protein
VKKWAWESYWLSQGVAAWLIAPWIFALFTVPGGTLMKILSESPSSAKLLAMLFGALWGIGGLTFGLSIRYLGVAMGQSIALGFCAAFGTLIPPIVAGDNLFGSTAGILTLIGVAICIAGIVIIGYAGSLKNKNLTDEERKAAVKEFALKKGLIIAVFAGIMSACFNYGFEVGKPINEVARQYGTNELFLSNPTLIFILLGGFVTNCAYCVYLNIKNKTGRDYFSVDAGTFLNNIFFTFLAGLLWFLQFHFFGMGKISFSNIWGIILKEWKGVGRKTMIVLIIGIIVLILSTFVVNLG